MTERAFISWVSAEAGGRRQPPAGPVYSTVARFEEDPNWPDAAWSVVLDFEKTLTGGRHTVASIRFLVKDAPDALLHNGSRFVLLEGKKIVAKGVVLSSSTPIPDQISEFEAALAG